MMAQVKRQGGATKINKGVEERGFAERKEWGKCGKYIWVGKVTSISRIKTHIPPYFYAGDVREATNLLSATHSTRQRGLIPLSP